jgi:hypothetical protein
MFPRGLVGRCGEVLIAATTAAAASDDYLLVGMREVVNQLSGFIVVDRSANRYLQDQVFAFFAGAIGTFAVTTAIGFVLGVETEVNKGVMSLTRHHDDVAAIAAVATRRATARNKFFPAEGHTAVATVSRFDTDFCFVDKHFYCLV